jgi:L-histidine Nalpha-methyltransferase
VQSTQTDYSRLRWMTLGGSDLSVDDGSEVVQGLSQTPKTLPCRYFYDDLGSALFEKICDLPEYYPTRTEQALLETYSSEISALTGPCELVELGSGSSRKTRLILDAYSQLDNQLQYCPIDISAGILKATALDLLHQYPTLHLCGLAGTYEQALAQLPRTSLKNRMLIFLGSTLGNLNELECQDFLTLIRQALQPGEFFLLGVDLQKPVSVLEAAYNDAQGVTAAFNLNILTHLNRRFQGNFDPAQFEHWAFYCTNADNNDRLRTDRTHQIEMHLRSLQPQTIAFKDLDFEVSLQAGETIRTEISRKFHLPTLTALLETHAIAPLHTWTDPNAWFALLLCQRQCTTHDCP